MDKIQQCGYEKNNGKPLDQSIFNGQPPEVRSASPTYSGDYIMFFDADGHTLPFKKYSIKNNGFQNWGSIERK